MGFIAAIVLIISGLLASSGLIVKKKPEAREVIDKMSKWQGGIGFFVFLWGIWAVIHAILTIGLLGTVPVWWITYLVANCMAVLTGFLLGYGLILKTALKNAEPEKKEKARKYHDKLEAIHTPLGITTLALGIWTLIATLIF